LVGLTVDGFDFNNRKVLTVAAALFVALATLLLKDNDFFVLLVFEDCYFNGCTLDEWCAEASVRAFADHEDFIDVNRVACFRFGKEVNFENIAFSYGKLAALCFDSGFHGKSWRANRTGWLNQEVFSLFSGYFGMSLHWGLLL
jgi:hypothetical protein